MSKVCWSHHQLHYHCQISCMPACPSLPLSGHVSFPFAFGTVLALTSPHALTCWWHWMQWLSRSTSPTSHAHCPALSAYDLCCIQCIGLVKHRYQLPCLFLGTTWGVYDLECISCNAMGHVSSMTHACCLVPWLRMTFALAKHHRDEPACLLLGS